MKPNNRKIGSRYEDLAAAYLSEAGYRILTRNYRNRFGEIDIIAADPKGTLRWRLSHLPNAARSRGSRCSI